MTIATVRPEEAAGDPVDPTSASQVRAPGPTVLPALSADNRTPPRARRQLGGASRNDRLNVAGAGLSACCVALLLFGRITPLTGRFGFVVVTWVIFVAIYALLVWLVDEGPAVVDKVMTVVLYSAATLLVCGLFSVVTFTLWRGRTALPKLNLYTQDMSRAGPREPLSVGGIKHALYGTLCMISIALCITIPLGIACASYLNESRSRASRFVRTVVEAMTALPSVLAGLFIFATWILILGFGRSGLAAAFALSIMMLPIIIRASDVVLRLVPGNLREASAALGAPAWRTVWHVVLTAIFISEIASLKLKQTLIAMVDLMAAVPSVVFGLWGLYFLQTQVIGLSRWLTTWFGWIPLFKVDGSDPSNPLGNSSVYTSSTFIAGIVVALMVMPIQCSVMREVFSQAPPGEREGAFALGASRWGMVRSVVIPFGMGGMIGGTMLGLGRAMGETIAVLLIISPSFTINFHILQSGSNSVSSLIALRASESTDFPLSALMAAGLSLFTLTLIINFTASAFVARSRSGASSEG